MTEKTFTLEQINPGDFFGINNHNLVLIENHFPKLKIIARGSMIKVKGSKQDISSFEDKYNILCDHIQQSGHLSDRAISHLLTEHPPLPVKESSDTDIILFGNQGTIIKARTPNQRKILKAYGKSDLIFAIGPAGSGKTYTAVALAVRALKNKEVKRIILTRPAVEAGENLGYLPGDLKEKLDPYMRPLYDALRDMLPGNRLAEYLEKGIIEIAPLAFMRGRTLQHSFVILDEAQNTTPNQLKMFLTRMGKTSKFMVTGDITQIDLLRNQVSGLVHAAAIMKGIKGIEFIELDHKDVIRHKLVTQIIDAYEKDS